MFFQILYLLKIRDRFVRGGAKWWPSKRIVLDFYEFQDVKMLATRYNCHEVDESSLLVAAEAAPAPGPADGVGDSIL